ncbi:conserved membrane hypothetical protein [Flavobacterium sp. 9AF]|uniref:DUF1361 domain-containing protein n=1 Tax=Flavobacterium sp. 9AF TaxID=2653142 RepID=UPI0012EFD891|nr:DUF1361 domain-containing protein [Flavobacterium sp. 9AF]VXB69348.1 conserved membrane hypothetical protein [Flavobacterium sp. 9AF]
MQLIINAYLSNKKNNSFLLTLYLYCAFLLLCRAKLTQSVFYFFLIWNAFLATIPYLILLLAKQKIILLENSKIRILVFLLWLLFLPNSFYIVTDFVHLPKGNSNLFWFDLILLFSFSFLGFLLGLLALQEFKNCFSLFISTKILQYSIPAICMLNGFGIYLGRFLRFNSWDILTNPFPLFIDSFKCLLSTEALLFSMLYGSFIYLIYLFKNIFYGN